MKLKRILYSIWVAAILALAVAHCIHLTADFPNYSRWMDWSKYTDEGWYGNAAVQYYLRGSWFVPGDLNTAIACPVWPILEWLLFHFTGISIVAARSLSMALFFTNLLLSYKLVISQERRWVALLTVSLMVASSFLYCFSRLAILEPLLVCLTLVALLTAQRSALSTSHNRKIALAAALGLIIGIMMLTKTTAIFLLPGLFYMLWYPQRANRRDFLSCAAVAVAISGTLWGLYFMLLVRPHHLADYHYFFFVNRYWKPNTVFGWLSTFYYSLHGILWVDRVLVPLGLLIVIASLAIARSLWRNPLFVSSLLVLGGFTVFIAYINNMQPRYYALMAYFVFFTVAQAAASLMRSNKVLGVVVLAVITLGASWDVFELQGFVRYPEYTFVNAARNLTRYIDQHPNGNRLLLSVSGNEIGLITGIPSICDEFGTLDLPDKMRLYRPGWYAAWNDLDPGVLEDIQTGYSLEQVATFHAFDDDDRDTLVLYKLHQLPVAKDE